jgi:hypothetical protein
MSPNVDEAYTSAVLAAVRGGINFIDTSLNYRHQRSERAIGQAIIKLTQVGGTQRGSPLERSEQQATHFVSVGLVPRAMLETAVSERGQSPAEFECSEVPASGLWRRSALGSYRRSDRRLCGERALGRAQGSNEVRDSVAGSNQAGNGSPGVPATVTNSERNPLASRTT